jgi:hypothetical protein
VLVFIGAVSVFFVTPISARRGFVPEDFLDLRSADITLAAQRLKEGGGR